MNVGDVIRTIQLRFTTEGEQKATAALKGVQSAQEQLAKSSAHTAQVTETSSRHQLSMANSMERLERRFNQTARAQFEYERVQKQVNAAVAQNPALQARANDVLARAAAHYGAANAAQSSYSRGLQMAADNVGMFAARMGPMAASLSALGPAGILAGAAIAAIAFDAFKSVEAFQKFEAQNNVLERVIRATGHAAGVTAEDIHRMADEIGDISKVREAAQQLLTFRSVAGETFERTLKLADDLAATGFGNVQSAARALGRALEDPARGLTALRRAGIAMSESTVRVIQRMHETGDAAGAQNRILDEVQKRVGGAGAAKDAGLAGAYEKLADATQRVMERWGKQIVEGTRLVDVINSIAGAIDRADKSSRASASPQGQFEAASSRLSDMEANRDRAGTGRRGEAFDRQIELQRAEVERLRMEWLAAAVAIDDAAAATDRQAVAAQRALDIERIQGRGEKAIMSLAPDIAQVETLQQKVKDLQAIAKDPAAMEGFRFNAEQAADALGRAERQLKAMEGLKIQFPGVSLDTAKTLAGLRDQLGVAQAVTGQERLTAQQRALSNQLLLEGKTLLEASAISMAQRAIAEAQINSNAQGTLLGLQDQYVIVSATTETERLRAQENARINELIRQNVEPMLAASIAAQERLNAEKQIAVAADQAAAAYRRQAAAAADAAAASAAAASAADDAAWRAGTGQYSRHVPGKATVHVTNPMMKGYEQLLQDEYGGGGTVSQGTYHIPGKSGFIRHGYWFGGGVEPNEQGLEFSLNKRMESTLRSSGSLEAALNVAKAAPFDRADNLLQNLYQRIIDEKGETPEAEKFIEQELAFLKTKPRTFERDDLIKSLTDSLDNLRESTDALNGTIGLDPLYTQGHGYVGIGYNPHGGTSPRIPIDPNTQPYVPSLTQSTGTGGPMIQNAPVGGSITSPGRQLTDPLGRTVSGGSITSPGSTMIDPRTGRPIFGAAAGGMFMVGGAGGIDSKYVPLALTPGELIEVTPERETHHLGGKQQTVVNNVTHNNTFNFPPSRSYGDRRSQRHLTEGFGRAMAQAN